MKYYRIAAFIASVALVGLAVALFSLDAASAGGQTVILALKTQGLVAGPNMVPQQSSRAFSSPASMPRPSHLVEPGPESPTDDDENAAPPAVQAADNSSQASDADLTEGSESRTMPDEERPDSAGFGPEGEERAVPIIDEKRLTDLLAAYHARLVTLIEAQKRYPDIARRLRHQGIAQVRFTLTEKGEISSLTISDSSSHTELDEAALEAVRTVPEFPAFPSELGPADREFAVSLSFVLD